MLSCIALCCLTGPDIGQLAPKELHARAVSVVNVLEKRMFALLIQKGMTASDVERILGLPTSRFALGRSATYFYTDAGVQVSFEWDCPRRREFAPDIGEYIYVYDDGPLGSYPPGKYKDRVVRVEYSMPLSRVLFGQYFDARPSP
jgi:hypothetical protein